MDIPLSDDSEFSLLDTIQSEEFADCDTNKSDMSEMITKSLSNLSERERYVIINSFGIDVVEMTLSEIANVLGITSERVRQIRKSALKKLANTGLSSACVY